MGCSGEKLTAANAIATASASPAQTMESTAGPLPPTGFPILGERDARSCIVRTCSSRYFVRSISSSVVSPALMLTGISISPIHSCQAASV